MRFSETQDILPLFAPCAVPLCFMRSHALDSDNGGYPSRPTYCFKNVFGGLLQDQFLRPLLLPRTIRQLSENLITHTFSFHRI